MTLIDRTFLRVHPATRVWWMRRDKCRACRWYIRGEDTKHDMGSERCGAYRASKPGPHRYNHEWCIDARSEGWERDDGQDGLCGPGARLFEPRQGGDA